MLPQWLEISLGVKRALGILLRLLKDEAQTRHFGIYVVIRGDATSPFSVLPPKEFGPQMSYDRASATCVCVCVITHTVTHLLYTCLLFG